MHVLLIEDEPKMAKALQQGFADNMVQMDCAYDGLTGHAMAAENKYSVIISDIILPEMNGLEVLRQLRSEGNTTPVLLLSALGQTDDKVTGFELGADDYLTKPFNTEELLTRMENLVELRRRLRQRYGQLAATGLPDIVEEATFLNQPDRDFLRRFTLTLEQHLSDETIGVEDFAQKMSVSRVQLHRKLKALTDQNVSDFVRDYRLERAMAMLKNREGMVYEVASKVGFGSEKYFSRAFREKFGVLPSQIV